MYSKFDILFLKGQTLIVSVTLYLQAVNSKCKNTIINN